MDCRSQQMLKSITICALILISSMPYNSEATFESLSPEAPPEYQSSKLVTSICKESVNPEECEEAFAAIPRAKTVRTLNALAQLTLRLAVAFAKESLDFVNALVAKNGAVESVKQCAFWYKEVVASFQGALGDLEEDIQSANYDIKVAGDNADSCEEGLAVAKIPEPSLSARNAQIKLYSSIGFVITSRMDV